MDSEDRLAEIPGPDVTYMIRTDEELVAALEMEVYKVLPTWYKLEGFIGLEWISDDYLQFRLACKPDNFYRNEVYSIYLHRMLNVSQRLEWVELHYGTGEDDNPLIKVPE